MGLASSIALLLPVACQVTAGCIQASCCGVKDCLLLWRVPARAQSMGLACSIAFIPSCLPVSC